MTDTPSPARRPDPWAVVEHHAQRAAQLAEGSMTTAQRLALYASAAPGVIGAVRAQPGEFGLTRKGNDDDWWKVPVPGRTPGTPVFLAWNSAGEVIVQRRGATSARMIMAGSVSWVLGMIIFGRLGPRALLPALVVGVGAAILTRQLLPAWSPLGSLPDDQKYVALLEGLAERYEADVAR
jgi:hypothetical protein